MASQHGCLNFISVQCAELYFYVTGSCFNNNNNNDREFIEHFPRLKVLYNLIKEKQAVCKYRNTTHGIYYMDTQCQ